MDDSRYIEVQNLEFIGYPSTPHLQGSRLQKGDDDSKQTPYSRLAGRWIVIEEKLDASQAGLGFSAAGELLLQSRGHYLTGGAKERDFAVFKQWAACHEARLLERLEDRYVAFGEQMRKVHSIFYDALPHIFCEFDVWDRSRSCFLDTPSREKLFEGLPVLGVPVLYEGPAPKDLRELVSYLKPSLARTPAWRENLEKEIQRRGFDVHKTIQNLHQNDLAEGLYIKVEEDGQTVERYKWVDRYFVQALVDNGRHHSEQPFLTNWLADGVDIYSPSLTHLWPDGRRAPAASPAPRETRSETRHA